MLFYVLPVSLCKKHTFVIEVQIFWVLYVFRFCSLESTTRITIPAIVTERLWQRMQNPTILQQVHCLYSYNRLVLAEASDNEYQYPENHISA